MSMSYVELFSCKIKNFSDCIVHISWQEGLVTETDWQKYMNFLFWVSRNEMSQLLFMQQGTLAGQSPRDHTMQQILCKRLIEVEGVLLRLTFFVLVTDDNVAAFTEELKAGWG